MARITYYALHPDCYELFTTERFHTLIKNNPELEIVEVFYDNELEKDIFTPVFTSISAPPTQNIALIDHSNDDQFMWVIEPDHLTYVDDPSPLLIKALTLMDEFLLDFHEIRLFETTTGHLLDDNCILRSEYDFEEGDYDLETGLDWG